jgi:hypothetical protein
MVFLPFVIFSGGECTRVVRVVCGVADFLYVVNAREEGRLDGGVGGCIA